MITFDHFSKRMIAFGMMISMIFLAGSLFLFSIQPLTAHSTNNLPGNSMAVSTLSGTDYAAVVATDDAAYAFTFDAEGYCVATYRADASGWTQLR